MQQEEIDDIKYPVIDCSPSEGAMRAAEVIARRYQLGPNCSTRKLIAITIDKETASKDLLEAAENMVSSLNHSTTRLSPSGRVDLPNLRAAIEHAKRVS